jgi:hypothetical protein
MKVHAYLQRVPFFYNYLINPCGQFLFYECQVLAFVFSGEPIKEVNHPKKKKVKNMTPQLINNNHINILRNPIVSKTKICNLTITMEVKN